MTLLKNSKLANSWPWNKEWIAFAFWLPGLSGLLLTYLSKPYLGKSAYWLLAISFWGLIFSMLYGYVSTKISKRLSILKQKGLEPVDGLISFGKLQAPTAIALTKEKLFFAPIVGPEFSYELSNLESMSMQSSIPGKKFFFKVAFHLQFEDKPLIAFAVTSEIAKELNTIFEASRIHQ